MKKMVLLVALASIPGALYAEDVMEFKNKKGTVFFPHKKHERLVLHDCKVCHDYPGAIDNFGKAVAHKLCIGCHEPEPGHVEGPITCEGCHSVS